ncbi:MAG: hypothetical protein RIC55_12290 [Pirellulaceae bacterium]
MLRFTATAWAKLEFLRDYGDSEIGGFGISAEDDPLLVTDLRLVRQHCTATSVQFDDLSVADFFDEQVDLGRRLESFARIWVHTHPGVSPTPSGQDEETFVRCFGRVDWAVMFILAEEGASYARLRFNVGPGGEMELPVVVDFSHAFAASDHEMWTEEYCQNVCDASASWDSQIDRRWESLDPVQPPDEFIDAWSDYVDDESGPAQQERNYLATNDTT